MGPLSHCFSAASRLGLPSVSYLHQGLHGNTSGPTESAGSVFSTSPLILLNPLWPPLSSLNMPNLCLPQGKPLVSPPFCVSCSPSPVFLVRGASSVRLPRPLYWKSQTTPPDHFLPSKVSLASYMYSLHVSIFCVPEVTYYCFWCLSFSSCCSNKSSLTKEA